MRLDRWFRRAETTKQMPGLLLQMLDPAKRGPHPNGPRALPCGIQVAAIIPLAPAHVSLDPYHRLEDVRRMERQARRMKHASDLVFPWSRHLFRWLQHMLHAYVMMAAIEWYERARRTS